MTEVKIDGTTFVTDARGGVMEWGTNLHYDGKGYQLDDDELLQIQRRMIDGVFADGSEHPLLWYTR